MSLISFPNDWINVYSSLKLETHSVDRLQCKPVGVV